MVNSDMLFPVIPRDNRPPLPQEEAKVREVDKEAKLRQLSDEEQELKPEEREAHQEHKHGHREEEKEALSEHAEHEDAADADVITKDDQGRKHIDCFM